jgi:hypothetical protein
MISEMRVARGEKSMRCAKCGNDNREGRKFCVECGQALKLACPSCGAPSEPWEKFCGDCGAALVLTTLPSGVQPPLKSSTAPDISITPQPADASLAIHGERKTVTALFADIHSSTELIRELDPEEARALVDPVLRLIVVAQDGLLADWFRREIDRSVNPGKISPMHRKRQSAGVAYNPTSVSPGRGAPPAVEPCQRLWIDMRFMRGSDDPPDPPFELSSEMSAS